MAQAEPVLVLDSNDTQAFPARYRIVNDNTVAMIGSGQFTKTQLIHIKETIKAPLFIIDLRQESHGFIGGVPISWYGIKNWDNQGKTMEEIESQQTARLTQLQHQTRLTAYQIVSKNAQGMITKTKPVTLHPAEILTEEQLARQLGLGYARFYVADHSPPSRDQLEAFTQIINTIPKNTWVYFHCRGGVGRTSTFMVLYAINKNAKHIPLDKIIRHQADIGGKDLTNMPAHNSYKYLLAKQRLALISQYYRHIIHK